MGSRHFLRLAVTAAVLFLAASVSVSAQSSTPRGRKYKAPPPTSRIEVSVLRSDDGHPIENAAVIFQMVGDKGNMELKTNDEGKAMIDVLPTGSKVVVQILAKGYQTYGRDYSIDKANMTIEVKLKRPGQQYSIYDNHPQDADAKDAGKDAAPKDASPKDSGKAASDSSSKQPDAKPDTGKPKPE